MYRKGKAPTEGKAEVSEGAGAGAGETKALTAAGEKKSPAVIRLHKDFSNIDVPEW